MRRIALLGLLMSLTSCAGFGNFIADTHTFQSNPNMPPGDSENMRRVTGADSTQQALTPEPGNIWPPPAGPMPTLMDLEKQTGSQTGTGTGTGGQGGGQGGSQGAPTQIQPTPGSSSPPQAGLGAPPAPMPRATTMPTIRAPAAGPAPSYQTPAGTAVPTGGGPGYTTTTTPGGGGQSIVVPNGNGTSTIIHSDGTVETVPTPK
jgi:hypothetical protein